MLYPASFLGDLNHFLYRMLEKIDAFRNNPSCGLVVLETLAVVRNWESALADMAIRRVWGGTLVEVLADTTSSLVWEEVPEEAPDDMAINRMGEAECALGKAVASRVPASLDRGT